MLYPILTPSRLLSDLSGIWDFKLDNEHGFDEKWYERPLTDAMTMPVPASYNDLKEGPDFRDFYGWVFYQRTFSLPKYIEENQRVVLRCDAVTHRAKVYLNGELIVEHKGGFLPFEVELNGRLRDGDNLLTIAVSNIIDYTTLPVGGKTDMLAMMGGNTGMPERKQNRPNFDFFNYCGITRPVRIYTTPRTWIDDVTVTADFDGEVKDGADVTLHVDTVVKGAAADGGKVKVEIFDKEGWKVAAADGGASRAGTAAGNPDGAGAVAGNPDGAGVTSGSSVGAAAAGGRIDVKLKSAQLWWPLKSYLYRVKLTVKAADGSTDVYELPYGIRTVRVEERNFLINEKPFYFKGYGKHEDTFPNGRGINIPMYVKDISIMKWQGANSFRTSHYPYSEEMIRLCDEEGIVIIDETSAVGVNLDFGGGANFQGQKVHTFDKEHGVQTFGHHKDVIRDLIDRDKNHACVVMWSIANEPDSYSEGAYEYFKPLFDEARDLDPQQRPCTLTSVGMAGGPKSDVSAKLSDVICLNRYYGWYAGGPDIEGSETLLRNELDEWQELGKPVVFTEYGADTVSGMHDTTPVMYTEEYQLDFYKMYSKVFDEYSCVRGEQVWNFADFATSQSLVRIQGNKKGLFTRDRKPKLAAHYLRERWTSIPEFGYKM
ncbi:beta-glucuronidase [Lachnospiraceae bacterium NK3A20]|nr:beta-glucuronidase [Lachnospiraceae bacterium NK3A20]